MLSEPSPTQIRRAVQLLAREGAAGSSEQCAQAAGRVYDKLLDHLAPLLGQAGVRALLARSVKLTQRRFSFLDVAAVEGSSALRAFLQGHDAAVAAEAAAALFGTFFALMTTFIGERLTSQALRRAWPAIEDTGPIPPTETNQ